MGPFQRLLAWDKNGDGVVTQVSTPSWPASGSKGLPRKNDGNTLGCVDDNDVDVSQHFFALKLNKDDLLTVLNAASKAKPIKQIVKNGGPADVQAAVNKLGVLAKSDKATMVTLSTGVRLISKPSNLVVPPWQMVSALLKPATATAGPALKAATWWTDPEIPPTDKAEKPECWDDALATPGPVAIATTGTWDGKKIGLTGGPQVTKNHAKIGVSEGGPSLSIFGDLNQQGTLAPTAQEDQGQSASQADMRQLAERARRYFLCAQRSEIIRQHDEVAEGRRRTGAAAVKPGNSRREFGLLTTRRGGLRRTQSRMWFPLFLIQLAGVTAYAG